MKPATTRSALCWPEAVTTEAYRSQVRPHTGTPPHVGVPHDSSCAHAGAGDGGHQLLASMPASTRRPPPTARVQPGHSMPAQRSAARAAHRPRRLLLALQLAVLGADRAQVRLRGCTRQVWAGGRVGGWVGGCGRVCRVGWVGRRLCGVEREPAAGGRRQAAGGRAGGAAHGGAPRSRAQLWLSCAHTKARAVGRRPTAHQSPRSGARAAPSRR